MKTIAVILFCLLAQCAGGTGKLVIKSQSDFDKIASSINTFIDSNKDSGSTATLDIVISDGEYLIGEQTVKYAKATEANVIVRIRPKHAGKVFIRSAYDVYPGQVASKLLHNPEVFPCMVTDGNESEIEFQKSGDGTEHGVNFASCTPEILNHAKHIARLGIPEDMPQIRNLKFTGDSLAANPYFKDAFMMVSTQWNRIMVKPLWTDSKYLYFDYVQDYNTLKGKGRFDEEYNKKTRLNIYNLPDVVANGKVSIKDGVLTSPTSVRLHYGASHICFENVCAKQIIISGLIFSGICSTGSFIEFKNCSNVLIEGNTFRNFCSGLKNGYILSFSGKSSKPATGINVSANTFLNSKSSHVMFSYCKACDISGNNFLLAGTYPNGRSAGISNCDDINVHDNYFRDNPSSFIWCGGAINAPGKVIIDNNEFSNSPEINARSYELCAIDMGFVYFWGGKNLSRVFSNNLMHDVQGYTNNRGLFIDDGSYNVTVEGNTISGTTLNYSIDARYTTAGAEGVSAKEVTTNNILRNNIAFGRVRWNGNKQAPNTSIVYNNFIKLAKGQTGNNFDYAKVDGDVLSDTESSSENGSTEIHTRLPWTPKGKAASSVRIAK